MNLGQVGQLGENRSITEGDVDYPVVSKGGQGGDNGRLLPSTRSGG